MVKKSKKPGKECEKGRKFWHCRVADPKLFHKKSFRTKAVGEKGKKIVLGCPKSKYDAKKKRCRVPMRIQKKLIPI